MNKNVVCIAIIWLHYMHVIAKQNRQIYS